MIRSTISATSLHSSPQLFHYLSMGLAALLALLLCNAVLLATKLPASRAGFSSSSLFQQNQRMMDDAFEELHSDDGDQNGNAKLVNELKDVNRRGEWSEAKLQAKLHQWETVIAKNLSLSESNNTKENAPEIAETSSKQVLVKSCRKMDCTNLAAREDRNFRVAFYNPLDQVRIICGKQIEPLSMLVVASSNACAQQPNVLSTLFPVVPTRHNQQLQKQLRHQPASSLSIPPVYLGIKGVPPSRSDIFAPFRSCDVKCFFLPNNLNTNTIARTVWGTNWLIATSMEGPVYYKSLMDNNDNKMDALNDQPRHRFFATTSFNSDIPMPYFSWDEYAPNHAATVSGVDYDRAIKGAVFIAHNCHSANKREDVVRSLIQLSQQQQQQISNQTSSSFWANATTALRIDSVSQCLRNHDPPAQKSHKGEIMNQYLFYLAFENQNFSDYITEKLWGSLFGSGSVPVYYGAPNVHDHVPSHSIIYVGDFPDTPALWKYLNEVAINRTLYESYQAWRKKPLPEEFLQKYNFTHTHSTCRMCRWAFAKRYGWGWNHAQQSIEEEDILLQERKLCWDEMTGLLVQSIKEKWRHSSLHEVEVDKDHTMCTTTPETANHDCEKSPPAFRRKNNVCSSSDYTPEGTPRARSITFEDGAFRRTVWNHDGFLDVSLERLPKVDSIKSINASSSFVLELQLPPPIDTKDENSSWNKKSHNYLWIQKGRTRYTLLASQGVVLAAPKSGEVQCSFTFQDQHKGLDNRLSGPTEIFRLRFVLEHLDTSNTDNSEISYFANLAKEDFYSAVERFLVTDKLQS